MTPKSRIRERRALQEYRAEVLEGVASYVEQIEVEEDSLALDLQAKIVLDIREAKY